MKAINHSVVVGMLLFSAIPLMAQGQGQQSQQQQSQQPSSQQKQQSEKSQQELKVSEQEMKQQVTDVNKASKLIGMTVKNKQGEDLGKIKDLVVDLQSGRIAYVVLSSGGTMGFGQKLVAIPIQALTVQSGAKALLLNLSKQQLAQAPGFKEQNWPNLNAAEKGQTIGLAQSPAGGGAGSQSQTAGGAGAQSQTATGGGASQPQADGDTNTQPQATGGTNSQSQQSSEQEASSQESITSLQQLTSAQDPSSLEGKQAKISNAQVQEVIGKDTLTVSSKGSKQQLLVKSQEPIENIKPGQTVSISGKIQSMPSDMSQMGIDPDAAKKIEGQKVYLQATQVKPTE